MIMGVFGWEELLDSNPLQLSLTFIDFNVSYYNKVKLKPKAVLSLFGVSTSLQVKLTTSGIFPVPSMVYTNAIITPMK